MNSELEACLTKAISEFKVRDILTKFGIPEDAEVKLEMQLGENSQPIASCSVPTTVKQDHLKCGSISWNEFEKSIKDEFINLALENYGLSKYMLPDAQKAFVEGNMPLNISFNSSSSQIRAMTISGTCCRRCRPPNDFMCCFIC